MRQSASSKPQHPRFTRREVLQAGSIGLMGLSMADGAALRGLAADVGQASSLPGESANRPSSPKPVIYTSRGVSWVV